MTPVSVFEAPNVSLILQFQSTDILHLLSNLFLQKHDEMNEHLKVTKITISENTICRMMMIDK